MTRAALAVAGLLAIVAPTTRTRAFSEPALYAEPTPTGGGGGRFFTGSPLDAFSCAVCHEGGTKPTVSLRGFPDSYQPGKTYDIEVRWTQPSEPHALNLEIVDTEGRAAGKLTLPEADELEEGDRCALAEDEGIRELQASYMVEQGARTIIGVRGCGARSLRFAFTAPDDEKIALTASIVRSDKSEDTKGDGVLELREISFRNGERPAGSEAKGCHVGIRATTSAGLWAHLAIVGALLLVRRILRNRSASRQRSVPVSANRG